MLSSSAIAPEMTDLRQQYVLPRLSGVYSFYDHWFRMALLCPQPKLMKIGKTAADEIKSLLEEIPSFPS